MNEREKTIVARLTEMVDNSLYELNHVTHSNPDVNNILLILNKMRTHISDGCLSDSYAHMIGVTSECANLVWNKLFGLNVGSISNKLLKRALSRVWMYTTEINTLLNSELHHGNDSVL